MPISCQLNAHVKAILPHWQRPHWNMMLHQTFTQCLSGHVKPKSGKSGFTSCWRFRLRKPTKLVNIGRFLSRCLWECPLTVVWWLSFKMETIPDCFWRFTIRCSALVPFYLVNNLLRGHLIEKSHMNISYMWWWLGECRIAIQKKLYSQARFQCICYVNVFLFSNFDRTNFKQFFLFQFWHWISHWHLPLAGHYLEAFISLSSAMFLKANTKIEHKDRLSNALSHKPKSHHSLKVSIVTVASQ